MSGIVGKYCLDGGPVHRVDIERMMDSIAHRGPDGSGLWTDGPIGLGHLMLWTTPESLREKLPRVNNTGDNVITADARIDNRDDLIATLNLNGRPREMITDSEIILAAYEKWGEMCPEKLLGDFSFAIWDKRRQQIYCARDPFGIKPFYYYIDGRAFLFGSDLRPLFEDTNVQQRPNEGMIGEYLAAAITDNEETLYQDIFRLPPAHFLLVRPGMFQKERYWDINPAKEVRYRTDKEYAEHFLQIFKEAVRCRLRSHRPVGAELSGGLDSSSVVGAVQSLYREEGVNDLGFETFSLAFPGLGCDESDYIQDVVQMWHIESNAVCADIAVTSCYAEQVHRYQDFPDYPNGVMLYPLMSLAREKGVRVLLTGNGGDDWLTGSLYHYADFLRQFKILSLIRQVRYDRKFKDGSGVPVVVFPSFPILRLGVFPLVPWTWRQLIKRILGRTRVPSWIDVQFARRIRLDERLNRENFKLRFSNFSKEDIYNNNLACGFLSHAYESGSRSESWFGVEKRHPFMDRRVVEYALALPEEQRWRWDQLKFVVRRAMQGLVPERILRRDTKADFSHVFAEALQVQESERLFDSLLMERMRWVDGEVLRKNYRKMAEDFASGDLTYIFYIRRLWMTFGIELWFNTIFSKKQAVSLPNAA
jgi:asparagine synthase (glutamine-hydrolysing)